MDDNLGIVRLKELLTRHLVSAAFDFDKTQTALAFLNDRIVQLERTYENAFLVASGETLKNLHEYSKLRSAVEDIIAAREEKEAYLSRYRMALTQVRLVTEASDVLYQMYLASKQAAKIAAEVSYDWRMFCTLVD